jgi:hypothetical protein
MKTLWLLLLMVIPLQLIHAQEVSTTPPPSHSAARWNRARL